MFFEDAFRTGPLATLTGPDSFLAADALHFGGTTDAASACASDDWRLCWFDLVMYELGRLRREVISGSHCC